MFFAQLRAILFILSFLSISLLFFSHNGFASSKKRGRSEATQVVENGDSPLLQRQAQRRTEASTTLSREQIHKNYLKRFPQFSQKDLDRIQEKADKLRVYLTQYKRILEIQEEYFRKLMEKEKSRAQTFQALPYAANVSSIVIAKNDVNNDLNAFNDADFTWVAIAVGACHNVKDQMKRLLENTNIFSEQQKPEIKKIYNQMFDVLKDISNWEFPRLDH